MASVDRTVGPDHNTGGVGVKGQLYHQIFTRFTDELFAILISLIFIFEVINKLQEGGRHVDHMSDQIVLKLSDVVKKKNKGGINIKPFQVQPTVHTRYHFGLFDTFPD